MSPLEHLHASQHDDLRLASDCQLEAYLNEVDLDTARRDLLPHTTVERRHLARIQGAA